MEIAAVRLELPAAAASVAETRSSVRAAMRGGPPASVEVAALLAGELAERALRATAAPIAVVVGGARGVVRVEVRDRSVGGAGALRRALADPLPAGRGLALVDALSTRWGIRAVRRGLTVWFELDVVRAVRYLDATRTE